MESISIKACAKLNLFLDITGKRADGYHTLSSIMQSVDLFDYVRISKGEDLSVRCSRSELDGENNIAYKAAALFFESSGVSPGADIYIEKRIPMDAGLAGGSADAAAVLFGLNLLFEACLSEAELKKIGVECGADVPFSLTGGTMLAEGIGDEFTALSPLPDCWIVIAKPENGMSTRESYRYYDEHQDEIPEHGNAQEFCPALEAGDLHAVCKSFYNVLESAVPGKTIDTIKQMFSDCGALGSAMTGSGTAVFGIFDDEAKAVSCKNALDEKYPSVFIARPTDFGVETDKSAAVTERLDSLDIKYERVEHPAVYTMEEMNTLGIFGKGVVGKNLFLRDAKGRRHFLVFVYGDKKVNLAAIEEKISIKHCSFGSAERLNKYLGLTKGSVSPLGVINDIGAKVEFVIDKEFIGCPYVGVHPNQNTATLWLSFAELEKVIKANGNSITYIDI